MELLQQYQSLRIEDMHLCDDLYHTITICKFFFTIILFCRNTIFKSLSLLIDSLFIFQLFLYNQISLFVPILNYELIREVRGHSRFRDCMTRSKTKNSLKSDLGKPFVICPTDHLVTFVGCLLDKLDDKKHFLIIHINCKG